MKIYSPTEVSNYLNCPMFWALKKKRYYPNSFSYGEVTAAIGTGIHKGAYEVNMAIKESGNSILPDLKEMAVSSALEAAKGELRKLLDNNCFPEARVEDWEDRIEAQVPKGTLAYIEQFPIHDKIVTSEEAFGSKRGESDYQGCIDIVLEDEKGVFPADIKTKQPFKSQWYKDQFIDSFKWSWQMYHYSWLLGAHKFYLIMIELKNKPIVSLHAFNVNETYAKQWYHTASHKWYEMEQLELGNNTPQISDNHYAYGRRCPFYRACLDFNLDESLMSAEYVKLEF